MKPEEHGIHRSLLLCGTLAPIVLMTIVFLVGKMTPGYDPVRDTISQMGTPDSPYAIVLTGGYMVYGLLMGAAACGLARSMGSTSTTKTVALLLGIHSLFTMLLGTFPDSLDVVPKSFADDLLHNAISAISYFPLLFGILLFRKIARQDRTLEVLGVFGLGVFTVNLPMPLIAHIEALEAVSGLLQRLLAGASFTWLALTFFLLYKRRNRLQERPPTRAFASR